MTTEHALAFVLFAIVAAITPGPSNMILTATGARVGVRRGLPSLFGVTVGMGFMMFVVAVGLGSLVLNRPPVLHGLKWCGAGFLLWLAWKIATAGRGDGTVATSIVGFRKAAAFQWVNPKSWLVCASAVGTYLHAGDESALRQSASFGVLFVLAAIPSCFVWLAFGAGLQRFLRTERAARAFNVAMGAVLAGSVVVIAR
jgi:threonine/homoserine/homoserine lactone efflux protein